VKKIVHRKKRGERLAHIPLQANNQRSHKRSKAKPSTLYRGIAGRPFERRFILADYVEVKRASFEDSDRIATRGA
jgi:hypothetical protein